MSALEAELEFLKSLRRIDEALKNPNLNIVGDKINITHIGRNEICFEVFGSHRYVRIGSRFIYYGNNAAPSKFDENFKYDYIYIVEYMSMNADQTILIHFENNICVPLDYMILYGKFYQL